MDQVIATKESIFKYKTISEIYESVCDLYLHDNRPWIIGFSGGKDSTCALQVIWYALLQLPEEERTKDVFVISSDTMVEIPFVADRIIEAHKSIDQEAAKQHLPFKSVLVMPKLQNSFWVNLLGRGYPAPSQKFRWCTERMKISPISDFILGQVAKSSEVTVVLGARKGESSSRDQVLKKSKERAYAHEVLPRHNTLPNAFIYTPVEDFTVDDVWQYLLNVKNPWNDSNQDLMAMYRSGQNEECPMVIDESTPSCGNTRFGCWTCTLVKKDKAMESLVDSGEEWLAPLLEFRDFLASTQIPEEKYKYRDYKRRTGKATFMKDEDGKKKGLIRGPYKHEFRRKLLKRLLEIQKNLPDDKHYTLITNEEILEIRRIWRLEWPDWEDSVSAICREVYGDEIDWKQDDVIDFGALEREVLDEVAQDHNLPRALLRKLLDKERLLSGLSRRSNITSDLDAILSEEWRSEEEVLSEIDSKETADATS